MNFLILGDKRKDPEIQRIKNENGFSTFIYSRNIYCVPTIECQAVNKILKKQLFASAAFILM